MTYKRIHFISAISLFKYKLQKTTFERILTSLLQLLGF